MMRWLPSCFPPELVKSSENPMSRSPRLAGSVLLWLCCVLGGVAGAQTKDVSQSSDTGRQKLTPAQWREDLQFAVDTFLVRDRSFSPEARTQFRDTIAELQKTVEAKSD